MSDRPNDIMRIRPEIDNTLSFDQMGLEEKFQNSTLRPILKLQNPILLCFFQNYIVTHKGVFYDLSIENRLAYIENVLYKDPKIRNTLKGIIIGHFTVEEYQDYATYHLSLNKRMMSMITERLKNQVEYFQPLKKK